MQNSNPKSEFWSFVSTRIQDPIQSVRDLSNSQFTRNYSIQSASQQYFVKVSERHDCLSAEADGLSALADSESIRVPKPVVNDSHGKLGFLVTEYINLRSRNSDFSRLASDLAKLHRTFGDSYGWHRDNYLGSSDQINSFSSDWTEFFRDNRLGYQFNLARESGVSNRLASMQDEVLDRVTIILDAHKVEPSLLHGDLWQGNCGFEEGGVPVIYDPAVYYGDREADIAMTRLFGGFPREFYDNYQREWPLPPGWQLRQTVYNLYHILNHFNLFGGSYLQHAESMCVQLLEADV